MDLLKNRGAEVARKETIIKNLKKRQKISCHAN
jgi:hypothetical protein